jgi:hypothetical protein
LPHQAVRTAVKRLAVLYNEAEDFARSYAFRQRYAALDLLANPEAGSTIDTENYLRLADLALREKRPDISRAAGELVFAQAKIGAGQADKPDPIPSPITFPDGWDDVLGSIQKSALAARFLINLGDAYRVSLKPPRFAEPVYLAATQIALNSPGPGTEVAMTAAARLATTRRMFNQDENNIELLKKSAAYDQDRHRFSFFEGVGRDTRSLFSEAFLDTLEWRKDRHLLDADQYADEAADIFGAEDNELFSRTAQVGRLKRRAKTTAQANSVSRWAGARAEFDQCQRSLNARVASGTGTADEMAVNWRRCQDATRQLREAAGVIAQSFPGQSVSHSGPELVRQVRQVLTDEEAAISILITQGSVWALVITRQGAEVHRARMNDAEVVEAIRSLRQALDPHFLEVSSPSDTPFPQYRDCPAFACPIIYGKSAGKSGARKEAVDRRLARCPSQYSA